MGLKFHLTVILVFLSLLFAVCVFNAFQLPNYQRKIEDAVKNTRDTFKDSLSEQEKTDMAIRFSKSIHFKTVSHQV